MSAAPPKSGSRSGPAQTRRALLIVDHGTRSDEANARLAGFAESVGRQRPGWLVRHAHMELAEPGFDQAIDLLVRSGVREIFVHLHFLGAGFHVRESIPNLVEAARQRHPSVEIETSAPLGDDPRLIEIVVGRMDARSSRNEDR